MFADMRDIHTRSGARAIAAAAHWRATRRDGHDRARDRQFRQRMARLERFGTASP